MEAHAIKRLNAGLIGMEREIVADFKSNEQQEKTDLVEYFGDRASQRLTDDEKIAKIGSYIEQLEKNPEDESYIINDKIRDQILRFIGSKLPVEIESYIPKMDIQKVIEVREEIIGKNRTSCDREDDIIKSCDITLKKHQAACIALLGRIYEAGFFGFQRCPGAAIKMYKWSTKLGSPMGTFRYAQCLENGWYTDRDPEKAFYFYRVSYKRNYIPALHRYGIILMKGNYYVPKNIMLGYHLLQMAATKATREYPYPCYDFGTIFTIKNTFFPLDHKYAFKMFMKGARLGCNRCQLELGKIFEKGCVVFKDNFRAFFWYKTAAEHGNPEAQYILASILIKEAQPHKFRIDVTKFFPKGTDLCLQGWRMCMKAASAGYPRAILLAAKILEAGRITDQDTLLSLWYYKIAGTLGIEEASEKVKKLEASIYPKIIPCGNEKGPLLFMRKFSEMLYSFKFNF